MLQNVYLLNLNLWLKIGETYQKTDTDFLESEASAFRDDGSTASTAVLVGDHLYVANVGDSRAVISKAGKGIAYWNLEVGILTYLYFIRPLKSSLISGI